MARGRTGVALVRRGGGDAAGPAEGIFTDSDLARRVLAQYLDPEETEVSKVMTPEPEHVRLGDPALEALGTMARRGFRHLPVLDDQGRVAGVLDIARCLHDAVAVLEKLQGALDGGDPTAHPLARRFLEGVAPGDVPAELRALLAPLVRSLLPTVGDLVQGQDPAARAVRPQDNAREAAARLAAGGGGGGGGGGGVRAVLVLEEGGRLAGVVTPELLLRKVVAKKLSPDFTACASVMDARPEVAAPGDSLLDALRRMHSYKCHDLPVVDEDSGRVLGAVNVLDVVKQAFGGDGDLDAWAWIINSDLDFFEDEAGGAPGGGGGGGGGDADGLLAAESPDLLPELPRVVVPGALRSPDPERDTMISDLSQDMGGFSVAGGESFAFKVTDAAGHMHRITAAADNLAGLTRAVAAKLAAEADAVVLKYTDDEGDEVAITCQQSLREAVNHAREAGNKALRLKVVIEEKQSPKKAAAVTSFTSAEADEKPGTGESTGVLSADDAAVKPPPEAGRGEAVVAAPAVGKAAEAGAGVEAAAPAVGEGKGGDSKAGGSSALVLVGGLAVVAAAAGVGAMFYLKANKKK